MALIRVSVYEKTVKAGLYERILAIATLHDGAWVIARPRGGIDDIWSLC